MPHYLVRRAGYYHLRIRVPTNLCLRLGRTEVQHSLKTGDKRLAKRQAATLSKALRKLFNRIYNGDMADMSDAKIQASIRNHIRKMLERDESPRVMGEAPSKPNADFPGWEAMPIHFKQLLAESRTNTLFGRGLDVIKEYNLDIEPDSFEHKKFERELLKALVKCWEIKIHRDKGDYDFEKGLFDDPLPLVPISQPDKSTTQPEQPEPQELLSDAVSRYLKQELPRMAESSRAEFDTHLRLFQTVLGDIPVEGLTHSTCREFVDTLRELPSSWKKKKRYREKSLKQLLNMTIPPSDRLSGRTISNIVTNIGTFLNWAVGQGYIDNNYLKGKGPKGGKAGTSTRHPYSPQDLNALFHTNEYTNDTFDKPFKFWLPLLGLFTGARLEELCQLLVEDLYQADGIWCLNINDGGDKKLKNDSSHRIIPLHPVLTRDLKFHKWVQSLPRQGKNRIFSELKNRQKGKLGHTVSKWYGSFRKRCGVTEPFHALRNTFADTCKQLDLDQDKVAEVMGHKVMKMTYGHYANRYSPKILHRNVVKKIKFPVDLEHIKKSRFCGK